jgi:hypothetical protein
MKIVTRQYKDPATNNTVEIPFTFAGHVDDRLIEQFYIEDVKSNRGIEVVWRFDGKELRT